MYVGTDEKEERRLFTYEERSHALKRSKGKCACCGKVLTTKTMTMDHIIPISRGGKNEPENLVALCEECNKKKGNLLFLPQGYYTALEESYELNQMQKYTIEWFEKVKDRFSIERYPLIAPKTNVYLRLNKNDLRRKRKTYTPQLVIQWSYINRDYYDEIEAVTGISIREIREYLPTINHFDCRNDDEKPIVALYSLRKLSTDKILAVVAVQVMPSERHINIMLPWCDTSKSWTPQILYSFVSNILHTVISIANYEINTYTIVNDCEHGLDRFIQTSYMDSFIGVSYKYSKQTIENRDREFLLVLRKDVPEIRKTIDL